MANTLDNPGLGIGLGLVLGASYAVIFRFSPGAYADSVAVAAALGIPLWGLLSVILLPVLGGGSAQWTVEGMRNLFPALIGWVAYGAVLGLVSQLLSDLALRLFGPGGPTRQTSSHQLAEPKHIVILGGGFAGVTTAQHLETEFGPDKSVSFTLISDTNAMLFTPMLAEVASGSLEATHISNPLRTSLRRTEVVRGKVTGIDLEGHSVRLSPDDYFPKGRELQFDHLVLALGAVSNYRGSHNIQAHSLDFKTMADAIRIRNHVIDMFERADIEADPARRQAFLTFVIAGGGFSGAELAGGLNDFTHGMLAFYPNIPRTEIRVIVVHSNERILPELTEKLGAYALTRMHERGVIFKLNTRVVDAGPGFVHLQPAGPSEPVERIATRT